MKLMMKRYRITFVSHGRGTRKNAFIVHRPEGDMHFGTDDSGLYYWDAGTHTAHIALATAAKRDMVWNTMTDLKKEGTVHSVQQMMVFPSDTDYNSMVRGNIRGSSPYFADFSNPDSRLYLLRDGSSR